jgi:hypothetical protein
MSNTRHPCACCGSLTISEEFDICPVCFWECDHIQEQDATYPGGANQESLTQARDNFKTIGASSPRFVKLVRPARQEEQP